MRERHPLAKRTLTGEGGSSGAIELALDSDGTSFVVRTLKGGARGVVHWGPDMAEAIDAMNSQIDLAWRTLWTVQHRRLDGMDLAVTRDEITGALLRAMPAPPLGEELFG